MFKIWNNVTLIKKVRDMTKKPSRVLWFFFILLIINIVLSVIGYSVGTPLHYWLGQNITNSIAIAYFIIYPALILSLFFLENIIIGYILFMLVIFLGSFWNVASNIEPTLGNIFGAIMFILFIISQFDFDQKEDDIVTENIPIKAESKLSSSTASKLGYMMMVVIILGLGLAFYNVLR